MLMFSARCSSINLVRTDSTATPRRSRRDRLLPELTHRLVSKAVWFGRIDVVGGRSLSEIRVEIRRRNRYSVVPIGREFGDNQVVFLNGSVDWTVERHHCRVLGEERNFPGISNRRDHPLHVVLVAPGVAGISW